MLGLFSVNIPLLYGEGEKTFVVSRCAAQLILMATVHGPLTCSGPNAHIDEHSRKAPAPCVGVSPPLVACVCRAREALHLFHKPMRI